MNRTHTQGGERPYRSHLRPACLPCRRRKSRCQTEGLAAGGTGGGACLMCRAHGTECVYPGSGEQQPSASPKSASIDRRHRPRRASGVRDGNPGYSFRGPDERRVPLPNSLSPSVGRSTTSSGNTLSATASVQAHTSTVHGLSDGRPLHQATNHRGDVDEVDQSSLEFGTADDHALNLHILGPAVTKDNQVLSDYLSAIPGAGRGTRVVPVPASRSRPVIFTRVQKRPVGRSGNRSPSAEKLEIIERLLEPYASDVIDVFFRKVNICFPVLDEVSFRGQYEQNKDRISPALLACLYAHTMVHWQHSLPLSKHRCPDSRFIWNLANDALYSELHLSPGMSTIKAILLNIGGLPTTSLIGNGVLLGSAVSLAHSLGLNHNPLTWEIPQSEKFLRMKIWWALLVHDRWASLAHGTPPHLSRINYDVPPPTLEYLCSSDPSSTTQRQQVRAASVFIALVSLTEVLDQLLNFIYRVDGDRSSAPENLELELNTWVESLSGAVRSIILRGSQLDEPGASSLRFSYLTTRLLLQRIQLEVDKTTHGSQDERLLNRYLQARRTAEDILIMTQELQPQHLGDFWLSPTAFSYPDVVNFLLRCALETEVSPAALVKSPSFRLARDLVDTLRNHQEKHSWYVGDVCLVQHADIVDKILSSVSSHDSHAPGDSHSSNTGEDGNELGAGFDVQDLMLSDASIIDQFFPSLWDPLQLQNLW